MCIRGDTGGRFVRVRHGTGLHNARCAAYRSATTPAAFRARLSSWGTRLLNRVEAFLEHCPEAPAVFANPAMHDAVSAALGRPYVLFKEKLNLKPAGSGG